MGYYLAARKLWHKKYHLGIICCAIRTCDRTVDELVGKILCSYGLICFLLIVLLVDLLSQRHVRPKIMLALFFLPPLRVTVTTVRGYLLESLDKLNLLSHLG